MSSRATHYDRWATRPFAGLVVTLLFLTTDPAVAQNQWIMQNSGTHKTLNGVAFADANTGIVVGNGGVVLRTTDGGTHWNSQRSGTTFPLKGVCFSNGSTGFAAGMGIILRTTNGGISWVSVLRDTVMGMLVGGGGLPNVAHCWSGVGFSNSRCGTVVGMGGEIILTTNGGETWSSQKSRLSAIANQQIDDGPMYNGVSCTEQNTITAVGDYGEIVHSYDGGEHWLNWSLHADTSYLHSRSAYLARFGLSPILFAVSFINANTGTVVGDGVILRTTGEGITWRNQLTTDASILRRSHWGIEWNPKIMYDERYGLVAVSFLDANTGTVVGVNGVILHTTDGGTTWTNQSSGFSQGLNAVSMTDAYTGTAVGENGTILRTTKHQQEIAARGEHIAERKERERDRKLELARKNQYPSSGISVGEMFRRSQAAALLQGFSSSPPNSNTSAPAKISVSVTCPHCSNTVVAQLDDNTSGSKATPCTCGHHVNVRYHSMKGQVTIEKVF